MKQLSPIGMILDFLETLNNQLFLDINGATSSPAWITHAPDTSFPSDHANVYFGTAFALFLGGAHRLAVVIFACAIAVAWPRVFLGVHFPLDMTGAASVALASWVLIAPLWRVAGTSATRFAESMYRRAFAWPISAGWIRD